MAYNILIVDDSSIVRSFIIKTLKLAEVPCGDIFEAANGKEALEVLEGRWIDLVFTDIHMPVMNGLQLVDQMDEDDLLKSVPVVIISSDGSTTRMERMLSKGVKAYLHKPVTPEAIKDLVDGIMQG